ncbi:DUF3576 domain-containing protein [Candidatus Pelagibacter sp. HIMB1593]|uniref:DUF3576 domain-containing protein n=1 Tax=Candidatus Pelagibacter sp. HIMB1593 TaxID=3413355 RepID=UPI003F84DA98
MYLSKKFKVITLLLIIPLFLFACKGPDGKFKLPGGDARKTPADPKKRVEQNIREGKGIRFNDVMGSNKGGVFDFASSNELWRASLDIIEFMPLSSVNYSGGIIITDWYSETNSPNESIKISIRFLTNEIRSDALDIKIFTRKCIDTLANCSFNELDGSLSTEIKKEILKKAAVYKKEIDAKKPESTYTYPNTGDEQR